jgi:hypothetical protein
MLVAEEAKKTVTFPVAAAGRSAASVRETTTAG